MIHPLCHSHDHNPAHTVAPCVRSTVGAEATITNVEGAFKGSKAKTCPSFREIFPFFHPVKDGARLGLYSRAYSHHLYSSALEDACDVQGTRVLHMIFPFFDL